MDVILTREEFIKLYLDQSRSIKELAKYLQVSENKIIRAAKSLGLSRKVPTNSLIIIDRK